MSALLTAALDAAERGWPVFMLGRSKRPVANCDACHDRHRPRPGHLRSPDLPRLLRRHHRPRPTSAASSPPSRGGQLAVRTGAVSGLVGVDVDPAHGGDDSLSDLMAERLVPRTLHVHTGSGGLHLYYRHPGQPIASRPMPNRPGIDIKADGGYLVLPPSIHHRTGRPYQWGSSRRTGGDAPRPDRRLPARMPADSSTPADHHPHHIAGGGISHPDKLLSAHPRRRTPRTQRQAPNDPLRRRERRRAHGRGRCHRPLRRRHRTHRRRTPSRPKRTRDPSRHHRRLP